MSGKNFIERENQQLGKFRALPHVFKVIGLVASTLSLMGWLYVLFNQLNPPYLLVVFQDLLLISMLLITISKEKVEDEYIHQLRLVSFGTAFVAGVFHAVFQPLVNYVFEGINQPDPSSYRGFDGFFTLLIMLAFQIIIFHSLKRLA
ncbi:MAG: hypothetical protein MRZ79_14885 [Bacteroidia bacterium]|nr:hypothetical protein [Bacteroidia bacterium]